jgi:hypothetical protein
LVAEAFLDLQGLAVAALCHVVVAAFLGKGAELVVAVGRARPW